MEWVIASGQSHTGIDDLHNSSMLILTRGWNNVNR
jgi:hypothetical protein